MDRHTPAVMLPPEAVAILRRAAATPTDTPLAKTKAIEQAIEKVKTLYPQFFKEQNDETEN